MCKGMVGWAEDKVELYAEGHFMLLKAVDLFGSLSYFEE